MSHEFDPRGKNEQPQIMSVTQAVEAFKGRWILMQVKQYDENGNPLDGEIMYTSQSRRKVSKALRKQPLRYEQQPDAGPYFIFHAPPHGNWLRRKIVSSILRI